MARAASGIAEWIKRYLKEEEPRSKSLIVSAFGDSIAPFAPGIWLRDLIRLMAPFGINERLVRTSAFRLVDEGWLEGRRDGRRSFYSLTKSGVRRFESAYGRIYTPPQNNWDQQWTVAILPRNGDSVPERGEMRRELEWAGFASPAPGVFLHPSAPHDTVRQILRDLGLTDRVLVLRAQSLEDFSSAAIETLAARLWNLSDVGTRYTSFVERFEPLAARLDKREVAPEQAFIAQTLLIHSFRRATLHDPRLPSAMLPANWPGLRAYALCRDIYRITCRPAHSHLTSAAAVAKQPVAKLGEHLRERFGGIEA